MIIPSIEDLLLAKELFNGYKSGVLSTSVESFLPNLIYFKSRQDHPRVCRTTLFNWNTSEHSASLRPFISNTEGFAERLNGIIGIEVVADVHQYDTPSITKSPAAAVYDWNESTGPDIETQPILQSTPFKRQGSKEHLPVLFKKKKRSSVDVADVIKDEIRNAYLGTTKVLTAHLKLGPQLRELREPFVSSLMDHMRKFPGHFYQPLCVIIDTLEDASRFRESNANGFHYKVIGGCHNFTAAEKLRLLDPTEEVYKTRMCTIYKDGLSEDAMMWLANHHNLVGEYRHNMNFTEKIQLCRHMYESSVMDPENKKWQESITTVLGKDHSTRIIKLLCKLAEMDASIYNLLQQMLSLFSEGNLKGQKLTPAEIVKGPDMKPYVLAELPTLPPEASRKLLSGLINHELTIAEYQKEAKTLHKLQTVQQMFLDLMCLVNWEDAAELYPEHTTREVLEHFCRMSLKKTPEQLKTFCRRLKLRSHENTADHTGEMGSIGFGICCDALSLNEEVIARRLSQFSGADLVILDMPKGWNGLQLKDCINLITSLNLNKQMEAFSTAILCETCEMAMVVRAVKETQHFGDPMEAFYLIPHGDQSEVLSNCVHGIVFAQRKHQGRDHRPLLWSSGSSDNFVMIAKDDPFYHDGIQVDLGQKPVELYRELVKLLSSPGQWIMDVCCGTGTGIIASLHEGRNVIGVDKDEEALSVMNLRVTQCMGRKKVLENDEAESSEESVHEGRDDSQNSSICSLEVLQEGQELD